MVIQKNILVFMGALKNLSSNKDSAETTNPQNT